MLKGLGGLGDMAKMMKKAQEMQGKMAQIQDDLEQVEVHGEAGAGLVKISANAKGEVKSSVADVLQGKSKDTSKTKKHRRDVARVLTVLREKQLIAEETKETKDA